MKHLLIKFASALAATVFALSVGAVAASPASATSTQSWNCREVIAQDITFFRYSTGSATTWPHTLYRYERFKSHGGYDGRFRAEFRWSGTSYWGYTTSNSSWVMQVPDYYCNW